MDIKLGTTFTLFQPGRKRLNPSYFLCVFRDTDANETRQAITQSIGDAVGPLLLELTEGTSDPLNGVIQLYSGDWVLTVYEQTSATNLDAANAYRNVWTELVRVSAQCDTDPGPQPYDPCAGCGGAECDLCTEIAKVSSTAQAIVDCIEDAEKTAAVQALICDPTTVNGTESDTPTITVLQGGEEVGTLNPATGVVTVEECPPPEPCDPLTATLNGVEIINEAEPCGVDVALDCADLVDAVVVEGAGTENTNGLYIRDDEAPVGSGYASGSPVYFLNASPARTIYGATSSDPDLYGWILYCPLTDAFLYLAEAIVAMPYDSSWSTENGDDPPPTVRQATIADLCPCEECEDVTVQLQDTDGNDIGAPDVYPSGTSTTKTAPDGTVTRDGLAFGSVLSGGTLNVPSDCPECPLDVTINGDAFETVADPCEDPTLEIEVLQSSGSTGVGSKQGTHWRIADSEISINGTPVADVMAEDSLNIPVVQGGSPVGSWDGTQWVVPECDTLCDLLGDVLPANVQDEILDCVTTETLYAIEDALVCDLDAEAYIARVQQADGAFLEGGVRDAICDFVVGLKADGLWNDIQASCIMAGARTLAGALIPLKGPAPTNVNFVGADYDRETGLKGDGSTKYLDSGRNNNADGQNDAHRAVCISEQDDTLTSTAYMGAGVADVGSDLLGKSGTPPYNAVVRSRTSAAFTAATSGMGCLGISRSGSANYTLRIAGVDQTVTATSQTPHSDNLFVFARNNSGSPSIPSNGRLTFYSIGGALSLSQLDARVTALMTAINAAI